MVAVKIINSKVSMMISMIIAIASIGIKDTNDTIIADPKIDRNVHNVKFTGDFGEAEFTFRNNPLQDNPKTSHLAALSVCGTLERIYKKEDQIGRAHV